MNSIDIRILLTKTEEQDKIQKRLEASRAKRALLSHQRKRLRALLDKNTNAIRAIDTAIVADYQVYSNINKTIEA